MRREFTGRKMAVALVAGFGVVVAVNLFMASLATRGFGGVVVENSYVASQKFNGWLEEAGRQNALGWAADVRRNDDGVIDIATKSVPTGATVEATLRRPLGKPETTALTFTEVAPGHFASDTPVGNGRWTIRLHIEAQGRRWSKQEPVE